MSFEPESSLRVITKGVPPEDVLKSAMEIPLVYALFPKIVLPEESTLSWEKHTVEIRIKKKNKKGLIVFIILKIKRISIKVIFAFNLVKIFEKKWCDCIINVKLTKFNVFIGAIRKSWNKKIIFDFFLI